MKKKLTFFIMISMGFCFLLAAPCFPQDGEIIISQVSFIGYHDGDNWSNIGWESSSDPYVYKSSGVYLVAPVNFPPDADGKRVHRILARVYDFNASGYVRLRLYKTNILTGTNTMVAEMATGSSASSNAWQTIELYRSSMSSVAIDQHKYAWYISCYISGADTNLRIGPVRIKFVL